MNIFERLKRKLVYTGLRGLPPSTRNELFPYLVEDFFEDAAYRHGYASLARSLRNLKLQGFYPRSVIDIGAFRGDWSREALKIFSEAAVLMVDANPEQERSLASATGEMGARAHFAIQLLGPEPREGVKFYQHTSGSSVLDELTTFPRTATTLGMSTLDQLMGGVRFEPPFLLKLDVQGFELEVLKGATEVLAQSEVVVLETSLLEYNKGAPLFDRVIAFMKAAGFVVYDFCGQLRRDADAVLFQTDVIFAREDSELRKRKKFWDTEPEA
jgi:FkbM family methyltransferase